VNSDKTGYGEVGSLVGGLFAPKAIHEGDQASGLRAYVAQNSEVKKTPTEPDYRALWDKLRTRLLARASERTLLNFPTEGALQAMAVLNVMTTLEFPS